MKIQRQVFGFNTRPGSDLAVAVVVTVVNVVNVVVVHDDDVIRAPSGYTRNRETQIPSEKSPDTETLKTMISCG